MILNCLLFQGKINGVELSMEHAEKILDTRNKMMHSCTTKMTDSELINFYTAIASFLNETIKSVPDDSELKTTLDTALHKVIEIRDLELTIDNLPAHATKSICYHLDHVQVYQQRNKDDKIKGTHQLQLILRAIGILFGNNGADMSRLENVSSVLTEENKRHSCEWEVKYKSLILAADAVKERERRASQYIETL